MQKDTHAYLTKLLNVFLSSDAKYTYADMQIMAEKVAERPFTSEDFKEVFSEMLQNGKILVVPSVPKYHLTKYVGCSSKAIDNILRPGTVSPMDCKELLKKIERYLKQTRIAPSTFGRKVMGDPTFVGRLRKGRNITTETAKRVNKFLESGEFH